MGLAIVATTASCTRHGELTLYCAHDAVHAAPVIEAFERAQGVKVRVVYDTEATKSLSLVERIRREKDHPRADVFWNNEWLGTRQLEQEDLLAPCDIGAGLRPFHAFGARLRVWIVNTNALPATAEAIARLEREDPSAICRAKPMFGTTLTHYAALARELGLDGLRDWHERTLRAGVREVPGNGMSKNLVAQGACKAGWTDTDDFIEARDSGAPVAMLPWRDGRGRVILIPNTVAVVRGARQPALARAFVRHLLSSETTVQLANSPARQIPLGAVDEARIPAEVAAWRRELANAVPLDGLPAERERVLAWLRGDPAP